MWFWFIFTLFFHYWVWYLLWGFDLWLLLCWGMFLVNLLWWEFYKEWMLHISTCFFCIYWNDIFLIPSLLDVMYLCWLICEYWTILHPWNKSHFIVGNDFFKCIVGFGLSMFLLRTFASVFIRDNWPVVLNWKKNCFL